MENNELSSNFGNALKESFLRLVSFTPLGVMASSQVAVSDLKKRSEDAFMTAWRQNPNNMQDPRACDAGQAMAMLLPVGTSLLSYASGYAPACQVAGDEFAKPAILPFARNQVIRAIRNF